MTKRLNDIMISSIDLFCLAAEHQSFTVAAQAAGISLRPSAKPSRDWKSVWVFRCLSAPPGRSGLTDAGRQYAEQCRAAMTLLHNAELQAAGKQEAPSGTVRISLPAAYAHWRLFP